MEKLKGADATVIDAGEAIIIQTPTAGGYGKPQVLRIQRAGGITGACRMTEYFMLAVLPSQ